MYTFDENGVYDPSYVYTDLYENEDGKLMYFVTNKAVVGYQYIQGTRYYFDEDGFAFDGEYTMAGETCLFERGQYVSCSTADVISAGMIGPKATYVLYTNGTFKIDGVGATYDYANHGNRPYAEDAWRIKKLEVAAGITKLGTGLMMNSYVANVVFEEGSALKTIGQNAFKQCYKLKEIELPYKVKTIETEAFCNCTNLAKIVMPASVTSISSSAFKNWDALTMYVVNGSYSMEYAINQSVALAWLNLEGLEEYPAHRLVFKFGDSYNAVEAQLFESDLEFKNK
jgi:hypothetical protein